MAKIQVKLTHREKPSAVHLDKYGLTTLNKGIAEIKIEKGDLKALQKQGKRDDKFTLEEIVPTKTTETAPETVEESKEPVTAEKAAEAPVEPKEAPVEPKKGG
jgi:hypothetical protein